MVGSLKMNTTLEYSTRVVQEGDRRCKKSTLNDLAYLTPLRIPLMNPVKVMYWWLLQTEKCLHKLEDAYRECKKSPNCSTLGGGGVLTVR